jgi:hypothetical protein
VPCVTSVTGSHGPVAPSTEPRHQAYLVADQDRAFSIAAAPTEHDRCTPATCNKPRPSCRSPLPSSPPRSNPSRRRRKTPLCFCTSFYHRSYMSYTIHMIYLYPCLCRAFVPVYLSICLSISVGRYGNVLRQFVFVLVMALWFFGHWFLSVCMCVVVCGPCLRAGRGNRSTFDHFDRGYVPP